MAAEDSIIEDNSTTLLRKMVSNSYDLVIDPPTPGVNSFLLLENGTDFLLLDDDSSKLILA